MDRKEFLVRTGQACACFGALVTLGGPRSGQAEEAAPCKEQEGKLAFTHAWVADLTEALDQFTDQTTRSSVLEACGRGCATRHAAAMIDEYQGDVEGLLAEIRSRWAEEVSYDETSGVATVKGRKQDHCPCPLAKQPPLTSPSFCLCSQGWFKQVFEAAYEGPVSVEAVETVLRGAERCSFRVQRA